MTRASASAGRAGWSTSRMLAAMVAVITTSRPTSTARITAAAATNRAMSGDRHGVDVGGVAGVPVEPDVDRPGRQGGPQGQGQRDAPVAAGYRTVGDRRLAVNGHG